MRFAAGSNGTLPLPWTKIPNVGVALALIAVVTVGPIAEMHCPVAGLVSHREMFTGNVALPVSADAVIVPVTPRFTVATANAPIPFIPGTFTMPSFVGVAAKAIMSGTGVAVAERSNVLIPG